MQSAEVNSRSDTMVRDHPPDLAEWRRAEAGPIVRWRVLRDLGVRLPKEEKAHLLRAMLAADEVRRWLDDLGRGPIHHS